MVRLVQNSFFGGQLDFEMMGRQDYQRYAKGATKLCNFNVMKRGGLDKRRGFDRLLKLTDATEFPGISVNTKFRAIPYAYTKTRGFVLLMSSVKCIVVGTNPVNQFKYYTVDDLDGVYTAQEIQELDYQQCGDILYIAHQNHPPAMIVHDIDGVGEHGFHYSEIGIGKSKFGIPSISGSTVTRRAVKDEDNDGSPAASVKTESYVVSAIYDGEETRPSAEYAKVSSPVSMATNYSNSTSYRMPWTDSQKIHLSITVNGRTSNGRTEYPDAVRIYKKAFNYYGLIGEIKIGATEIALTGSAVGTTGSGVSTTQNTGGGTNKLYDNTLTTADYGKGLLAVHVTTGKKVAFSTTANANKGGYVRMKLGHAYYTVEEDRVVFHYDGYKASSSGVTPYIRIFKDSGLTNRVGIVQLPASTGDMTVTVDKEDGETAEDFAARWADAFDEFCAGLTDTTYIDIPLSANVGATTMYLSPANCTVVFSNVVAFNVSAPGTKTFDDTYITPDASITPIDTTEEIPMSKAGDYPASVSISQQRLIWASSKNDPERIWMSAIGDFYSYEVHEIMTPSDAIDFMLPVTRFAKINHICEMRKLLLFNSACEWLVDSSSSMQGLTYETIQAYPQSYSGSSARLKPIICNNSLIFCERTGQSVRRFAYDLSNDGFAGRDVSILSASIFEFNSIVDWTYQQFPYSTLWCAMKDGSMASFEYMEEQDIMAWLTHRLGGGGEVQCVATSYAVSPALDDVVNVDEYEYATHEEIFAVVKRQGNLWLERMRPRTKTPTDNHAELEDSVYHALCMDGVRVLNSTNGYIPTTEEGAVWIPKDTTDGSPIDRDAALAKIASGVEVYEGFPFDAVYTSVYPNINNGLVGNGQFDIKHIQGAAFRLMHSFGGEVVPVGADTPEPIQYFYNDPQNDHRAQFDGEGGVTLFNHDTNVMSLPGVNNRDGRVTVRQGDVFPFSVLSYELDFEPETGGVRR